MKIRKPRHLTGAQLGLATILGVLSGIYIWKPSFVSHQNAVKPVVQADK